MWSDPALFTASIFQCYYEKMWLLQTKKQNLRKARIFSSVFLFVDDLCTFNNDIYHCNDIYPDELELKKKNEDPRKASFFDLSIRVHDRKFTTKLSDKRDFLSYQSHDFLGQKYTF